MSVPDAVPRLAWLTRRAQWAGVCGLVLVVAGVVGAAWRPALLGAAILGWLGWDLASGPGRSSQFSRSALAPVLRREDVEVRVVARPAPGTQAVWIHATAPGRRAVDAVVDVSGRAKVDIRLGTTLFRAGRQEVVGVELQGLGPDLALRQDVAQFPLNTTVVMPRIHPLAGLPLPLRLSGASGSHTSSRVGSSGDFHDVAPFVPGDRLRRIDWRATARLASGRGELLVRRVDATADATVILVIDSRDEIAARPETWSGAGTLAPQDITSLDIAREAAASLAARYLSMGDRVGAHDLGGWSAPMLPRAGRGQLDRMRLWLALAAPVGDPRQRLRPPPVPSGALVVVLSTFLDEVSVRVAGSYRALGHRTVAIDVLPPVHDLDVTAGRAIAARVALLDRSDRLLRLARQGVDLVVWRAPGHADPVPAASLALTALARPNPAMRGRWPR